MKVRIEVDGEAFDVDVERTAEGFRLACDDETLEARVRATGKQVVVEAGPKRHVVEVAGDHEAAVDGKPVRFHVARFEPGSARLVAGQAATVRAVMAGRLVQVLAKPGQAVRKGDPLFVLESMKMQNELPSPADSVVKEVLVEAGETVEAGRPLATLEPQPPASGRNP